MLVGELYAIFGFGRRLYGYFDNPEGDGVPVPLRHKVVLHRIPSAM